MDSWKEKAFKHAKDCYPYESCGMLIKQNNKVTFGACKNLVKDEPEYSFVIDPKDWAKYEDQGEVIGIVHNHPDGELKFSEGDIHSCNYLDVDFYLVDPDTKSIIKIEPQAK